LPDLHDPSDAITRTKLDRRHARAQLTSRTWRGHRHFATTRNEPLRWRHVGVRSFAMRTLCASETSTSPVRDSIRVHQIDCRSVIAGLISVYQSEQSQVVDVKKNHKTTQRASS